MMLAPGARVGRYRVEALIGSGGAAVVYRCRDVETGTQHALKVLMVPSETQKRRLISEGRIQGVVRHPNLVGLDDVIDFEGHPALVLELIDGPALDAVIRERGMLSIDQVDLIGRDVLTGLAAAHREGLVHRDLKPGNVLLDMRGGVRGKISDFGLAKDIDGAGTGTRTNISMGTPAYMAPEQIRDAKNVDARADVYAAGTLLYELLTSARAFPQPDIIGRYEASKSHSFIPPSTLRPDAPTAMCKAIWEALSFHPENRPADGAALLATWEGRRDAPDESTTWRTQDRQMLSRIAHQRPESGDSEAPTMLDDGGGAPPPPTNKAQGVFDEVPLLGGTPPQHLRSVTTTAGGRPRSTARDTVFGVLGGLSLLLLLMGLILAAAGTFVWWTAPVSAPPASELPAAEAAPIP